jgi:hypothetical protein
MTGSVQIDGHQQRLERVLFKNSRDFGAVPPWLGHAADRLRLRYDGVKTTREFQSVLHSFAEIERKPFEIFVVGEGNFGKSTILNALLGQELSKVAFLPETRCFLRFVPSPSPSKTARVFTRFGGADHDWLRSDLGPGRPAPELFEVLEHVVPVEVADRLLKEESDRCKRGGYEAAILELEKEVPVARHSTLPPRVRIVDTQGLNQLFTDELVKLAESLDAETSTKRFEQWMATTARGKHLEWQLRRCDAILWAAHARRPGSSVTVAALRHFRQYGKSVVLAATHIDNFDNDPEGRDEVLASIRETYGPYVAAIVPVNGKKALEGVKSGDLAMIEGSGLSQLAETFKKVVFAGGTMIRAAGAYNALRATERQLRHAFVVLRSEYDQNIRQLEAHRELVAQVHRDLGTTLKRDLESSANEALNALRSNLLFITLDDGPREVSSKLSEAAIAGKHQAVASRLFDAAVELAEAVAASILAQPYRLPTFDAEGKRAGDSVFAAVRVVVPTERLPSLNLEIQVPTQFFGKAFVLVADFFGIFFQAAREAAAQKRRELTSEKQDGVREAVERQWSAYASKVAAQIDPRLEMTFSEVRSGLDAVEHQLDNQEAEPMVATRDRLDGLLAEVAVEPILATSLVRALRKAGVGRLHESYLAASSPQSSPSRNPPL